MIYNKPMRKILKIVLSLILFSAHTGASEMPLNSHPQVIGLNPGLFDSSPVDRSQLCFQIDGFYRIAQGTKCPNELCSLFNDLNFLRLLIVDSSVSKLPLELLYKIKKNGLGIISKDPTNLISIELLNRIIIPIFKLTLEVRDQEIKDLQIEISKMTKKIALLFAFLFLTTISVAQKKEKIKGSKIVTVSVKEIPSFENIEINDNFEVFLVKSDKPSLEIEADYNLHEIINYEVAGGTLKVSSLREAFGMKKFAIRINYTSELKLIIAKNESSIKALIFPTQGNRKSNLQTR
jgi:hypothetical protein